MNSAGNQDTDPLLSAAFGANYASTSSSQESLQVHPDPIGTIRRPRLIRPEQMRFPHPRLLFGTLINSFLSTFLIGQQLSAFNIPVNILRNFTNDSYAAHYNKAGLSSQALEAFWGFIISSYIIGCVFGSFSVGYFAERFGRKNVLYIYSNFAIIVGSLFQALSFRANSFEMLIFGRILLGVCSGLNSGILPLYIVESTPDQFRGFMCNMVNLFITGNTLLAAVISTSNTLGTSDRLPYLFAIPAICAVIQLLLSPLFPESPKFLYVERRKVAEAEKAARFYYGDNVILDQVLEHFKKEEKVTQDCAFMDVLRDHNLRWPVFISLIVNIGALSTGIVTYFSYSVSIFTKAGIGTTNSEYATLGMSGLNLCGSFIATPLLDRAGRRTLFLMGTCICTLCNTIYLVCTEVHDKLYPSNTWLPWLGIAAIFIHVTVYNTGPGSIAWFYSGEVTPQSAHSISSGIAIGANWVTSLVINQLFPILYAEIDALAFLMMVIPCVLCSLFLYKYMPETKNRPIDEIVKQWWKPPTSTSSDNVLNVPDSHGAYPPYQTLDNDPHQVQ